MVTLSRSCESQSKHKVWAPCLWYGTEYFHLYRHLQRQGYCWQIYIFDLEIICALTISLLKGVFTPSMTRIFLFSSFVQVILVWSSREASEKEGGIVVCTWTREECFFSFYSTWSISRIEYKGRIIKYVVKLYIKIRTPAE